MADKKQPEPEQPAEEPKAEEPEAPAEAPSTFDLQFPNADKD